jgi:oxygen-dependent protoporphyrinogen oxidase
VAARRIVVVGGGIAGLAAAYALRESGAHVTVVEGANRLGGKLQTSQVAGAAVDEGAETFLARAPEAVDLARAVGLGADLVHPATTAAGVVVAGTAHPLPPRTVMGVPSEAAALAGLLPASAVERVRAEPDTPGEPLTHDVAVGELVGRRLGRPVVDLLVDPLLGGVYAGRADLLSLQATVPALAAEAARHGSLVVAARAVLAGTATSAEPVFATLSGGLATLVFAVAAASGAQLLLGLPVREISRTDRGFRLIAGPVPQPTVLEADAVIVAVPAAPAARLLRDVAPAAAAELSTVDYASLAIVTLAYPPGTDLPDGSGLLVPAVEGRAVKAVTYSSRKWTHLTGGPVIVRASVGRYGDAAVLQREDAELAGLAAAEVAALAGVSVPPIATRVTRWGGALPQYAVGHLDRVRRVRAAVAAVPGLAVAGATYDGVGIPACIRSGQAAAAILAAGAAGQGHWRHD